MSGTGFSGFNTHAQPTTSNASPHISPTGGFSVPVKVITLNTEMIVPKIGAAAIAAVQQAFGSSSSPRSGGSEDGHSFDPLPSASPTSTNTSDSSDPRSHTPSFRSASISPRVHYHVSPNSSSGEPTHFSSFAQPNSDTHESHSADILQTAASTAEASIVVTAKGAGSSPEPAKEHPSPTVTLTSPLRDRRRLTPKAIAAGSNLVSRTASGLPSKAQKAVVAATTAAAVIQCGATQQPDSISVPEGKRRSPVVAHLTLEFTDERIPLTQSQVKHLAKASPIVAAVIHSNPLPTAGSSQPPKSVLCSAATGGYLPPHF